MTDIRSETAKLLKNDYQIDESVTAKLFERGLIQEHVAVKLLVKNEYKKNVRPKEKQRLRGRLSEKFCISVSLVEKITLK